MKINQVSIWHLPLTSKQDYYMAAGKSCVTVESVIVRLNTGNGLSGWGETCPIPHYLPAYARGIAPAIEEMAPVLLGSDPFGVEALMQRLNAHLIGHPYAKSAIDIALWDLTGKAAGMPLYAMLGGRQCDTMPLYHSITCVEPEEMARMAKDAFDQGMRLFQVKLGADADWQKDAQRLIEVRAAVGTGPLVYGDWNCGASRLDATRVGRAVSHLDVMLEQPCTTIDGCAAVKSATGLPMKLDESAHDIDSLLDAHARGCMDAVAIKLSKFGGLSQARIARDLCTHFGVMMCMEDTWGADIATAASAHIGAATSPSVLMTVCDLAHYVTPQIASGTPVRERGRIRPPQGAGLGIEPDLDILGPADFIFD